MKISIWNLTLFEQAKTSTHFIMRVPGGWIITDRRGQSAVGTFVPFVDKNMETEDYLYFDSIDSDLTEVEYAKLAYGKHPED